MAQTSSQHSATSILTGLRSLLRGAGQVMFQNNAWTGLLFLAGIFWGSYASGLPQVAWGALTGLVASTLAGVLIGMNQEECNDGLYGFNGTLVGCAFPTFLADTWLMWVALVICAMTTTWVRKGFNNVMAPWKVNSLTFPFVFMTLIFLLTAKTLHGLPETGLSAPVLDSVFTTSGLDVSFGALVIYWLKGVAQVFLIDNWVTGIFFLVALAINSWRSAMWAAIASAVCVALGFLFKAQPSDVASGLYCFSAVLTGIALGSTFCPKGWKTALWTLIGIIVTFFIQAGCDALMEPFGLPTLTGPFCIATWLFLLPCYNLSSKKTEAK